MLKKLTAAFGRFFFARESNVTFHITTGNADSFRKSQAQITREMRRNLGKGHP